MQSAAARRRYQVSPRSAPTRAKLSAGLKGKIVLLVRNLAFVREHLFEPVQTNIPSGLFYQTLVHTRCCGMEGKVVTWTMHLDHPVGQCVTHGLAVCPPQFLVDHLFGGSIGPPSFTFAVGIAVLIYMRLSGTIGPRL